MAPVAARKGDWTWLSSIFRRARNGPACDIALHFLRTLAFFQCVASGKRNKRQTRKQERKA